MSEALSTPPEELGLVSDRITTHIWNFTDESTYGTVNTAHAEFVGMSKDAIEHTSIYDFLCPTEADICVRNNKTVFETKEAVVTEEWHIDSKSGKRLLRITKTPVLDASGNVVSIDCSAADITEDRVAENQHLETENILGAIVDFSYELFSNKENAIESGISVLGRALDVDRVYYWENSYENDGDQWLTSQIFEWCSPAVEAQIDNDELQNIPLDECGDFVLPLVKNQPYIAHIKDIPEGNTKDVLASQQIQSILVLPLFLGEIFKGFVGFDSCIREREWSDTEVSLLGTFVHLLGKSIEKANLELALGKDKQNFNNFFNTIDQLLFVLDHEGVMLDVNQTVLARTGYDKSELIGQSVLIMHPEHRRDEALQNVTDMLLGKAEFCPIPIMTKSGYEIPVETRVCFGEWNGTPALFGTSKDITDLKLAEEKFSKAFNNNATLMAIASAEDGTFAEVNAAFCDLLEYSKEEVIGKNGLELNMIVGKDGIDLVTEIFKSKGSLVNAEVEIQGKYNRRHIVLMNSQAIYVGTSHVFVITMSDITQKQMMAQEIERYNTQLETMVQEKVDELSESQMATIKALVVLVESRDRDTGNHLKRLEEGCRILATRMRGYGDLRVLIDLDFIDTLAKASYLHDIGKVAIRDSVLLKPGRLTACEFDEIKEHTTIGAQTLQEIYEHYQGNKTIQTAIEIAQSHHERWDGTGYPAGLQGNAIPLSAQITAICDVYDAIRSRRCYKEPSTHAEGLELILAEKGKHFNPLLVKAFMESEKEIEVLYDEFLD